MKLKVIEYIVLAMFVPSLVLAQNPGAAHPENDQGWMAFGIGPAIEYDFLSTININYGREYFFQGACHRVENFSIGNNPNHVTSVSAGFGYSKVSRFTRIAFSTGLSYLFGKILSNSSHTHYKFNTFGLFLNTQASFTPIKELGLGLDIFVNLNKEERIAGVALTIFLEGNK